jgi:hypothetical protein
MSDRNMPIWQILALIRHFRPEMEHRIAAKQTGALEAAE